MGIGVFWAILAAVLLGFYALPVKFVRNYTEENIGGVFWLLAMFLLPVLATFVLVDNPGDTYSQVPGGIFIAVLLLSLLWGVDNLLWGISISRIGMALGFSLLIGVTTLVGSILPFFLGGMDKLGTTGGLIILAGIFVIMFGIIANGKAGLLREKSETGSTGQEKKTTSTMRRGIIMCIVGGICAAGFNLSYHVAENLGHIGAISQEQYGNPPWIARLAVMLPSFIGSGVATVFYFIFRLTRSRSWIHFTESGSGRNLLMIVIMALVYCSSLIIYGLGAYKLGSLGTSVGFAIFQSGCIIVANLLGLFTGEWKNAGVPSKRWLLGGLSVMSAGIVVVAYGNSIIY